MNNPKVAIVVLGHKRPDFLCEVISSSLENSKWPIFTFVDGARDVLDRALVQECIDTCNALARTNQRLQVFERPRNLGLSANVTDSIDQISKLFDWIVVLEDDCLPEASFFKYCEDMAIGFSQSDHVAIFSGTNMAYSASEEIEKVGSCVRFVRHPYIWGWMTSASAWTRFRTESAGVSLARSLTDGLNAIPGMFAKILWANLALRRKRLGTWDISFAEYIHANNLLVGVPKQSLIKNVGFDARSNNTNLEKIFTIAPTGRWVTCNTAEIEPIFDKSLGVRLSRAQFSRLLGSLIREPHLLLRVLARFFTR